MESEIESARERESQRKRCGTDHHFDKNIAKTENKSSHFIAVCMHKRNQRNYRNDQSADAHRFAGGYGDHRTDVYVCVCSQVTGAERRPTTCIIKVN